VISGQYSVTSKQAEGAPYLPVVGICGLQPSASCYDTAMKTVAYGACAALLWACLTVVSPPFGQAQQHAGQGSPVAAASDERPRHIIIDTAPGKDWWDKVYIGLTAALTVLAVLTLTAVSYQAAKTREAAEAAKEGAEAALKQANHTVASERAWIIANVNTAPSPVNADVPVKIFPTFKNAGKTPAFLIEKSESSQTLDSGTSLPVDPVYPMPEKWDGNGVPLAPNEVLPIFLRSIEFDRSPREMFFHGKVFWIWGYIKYRDVFGNDRETRYCYSYEMVKASENTFEMIAYYLVGPAAYNGTT
jgi:hypothetical protein